MELSFDEGSLEVYKALASAPRLEILSHLSKGPQTATDLAEKLFLSKAVLSRHLSQLEEVGLIKQTQAPNSTDARKRYYRMNVDRAEIVFPQKIYVPFDRIRQEIGVGFYSDFSIEPTCGLLTENEIIGQIDDPRSFVLSERVNASIVWFNNGYVEYRIPNPLNPGMKCEMLEVSAELSSEFPGSNNTWKSDITFTINGVDVATWTSPGNFSDVRGKLTPTWWDSSFSQYGLLKTVNVYENSVGIDGEEVSNVKLADLHIEDSPFITLKIGIKPDAEYNGGITIFGKHFGNYPRDIVINTYYSLTDEA
ncbi:MAG: helix-turn-helix domain-containing protein [Actinomycetaceae bacterium]|nr:helix-turn-helix domain-containing protein [Actinomycetaceae bacterium]